MVTAGLIAYANYGGRPTLHLDVELTEKACCSFQVWVNGFGPYDATTVPVRPGTRATYSVPLQTQFVHFLRIALAGQSAVGDTLRVHRIWTARGDTTIDEITAEEFRQLGGSNVVVRPEGAGVTLRTTNQYPYIETRAGLITDAGPRRLFFIELGESPLPAIAAILLIAAALTALFAAATWRHVVTVLAVGATLLVFLALPWATQRFFEFRDDLSEAVGYSSYAGVWKTRDRMILELGALAAFVIPAIAALGFRLLERHGITKAVAAEQPGPRRRLSIRAAIPIVTAPIVALGLLGMPDIKAMIGAGRSAVYSPHFDSNNFLFWKYLIRKTDLEPMKDFFWPYGFQWIFQEGLPWGQLASYAVYLSFWVWLTLGTYWALARFFGGRRLVARYAGLMGFWLIVALAGLIPFPTRYIGPLGVVLLFAGIESRDRLLSAKRVVFGVAMLELTVFELAQAAYALVPIAFLVATELVLDVRRRSELLRWLQRSAATVGVPFFAALGVYAVTGTLGANIDYYGEFDALNSAYAYPTAIDAWIRDPRSIEAAVLWAVPLTIALGMCGLLLQRGEARRAQAVVVALGVLGLMVMQKQVLRPHAATQIWQTALFGLAFWAAVETSLHAVRRWMAVAAAGATAFAVILMSGELRFGWEAVTRGPQRALATIEATFNAREDFAADERVEFEPQRFRHFPGYPAVVRQLRRDPTVQAGGRVWILGDDSPITIMLGRAWPYYYPDLYDTSPISFQQRVLSRLERDPPQRVVWNLFASSYDSVPHVVRVPLLFDWTVRHFALHRLTDMFAVLRPLEPGESPDLDWWRTRLGATVNLGHVPEATTVHGGECSERERCETYVVIEYPDSVVPPPELAVPIHVAGHLFEVKFPTSVDSSRYIVRLDRLWFWTAAPPGARRRVDTTGLNGATVKLERRTIDANSLY